MKDFNLVQYLRENKQGSFGMLNHYVDLKPLKEEDQEVPYPGPEDKLDGFGDSFDQVEAIPELEKPENIYNNSWMNSSVDNKKIGNWTCYYDDQLKALYWIHDQILSEDIIVYATPNWDGAKGIAVEVHIDYGGLLVDQDTIGAPSYPDFNSYAEDIAPFLKMVENKYFKGDYDQYKNDEVDGEDTSLSEMYTDMKEEGEGFQSQHSDSADWERFYQEGYNAGYDEGYRDAKKEFNTTGKNDYFQRRMS